MESMSLNRAADSKWPGKLKPRTSISPYNMDIIQGPPSYIVHMRNIQLFSLQQLKLEVGSFSKVSTTFILLSLMVNLVNLAHQWMPQLALQWYDKGPFSAILTMMEKIIHSAVPFLFIATSLINKFKFERTTIRFLAILKALGLWKYKLFFSCKVALVMFAIGITALVIRNALLFWTKRTDILGVLDDVIWGFYYFYIFSWAFAFSYSIRVVSFCFQKLTKITLERKTDLKSYFQIYNRLVDTAAEMNDFYDIPVSVVLLLLLLSFVDYTNSIIGEQDNMHVYDKLYVYVWMTILLVLLIYILGTCHSATEEANSSNEFLFKYLLHNKNISQQENPLLIIHLCAKKSLVFRACKSFTINYNLGISMVAAYATYIVVIYQVDHSGPSNPANNTNASLSKN